ncbi:sulfate adenylyltransferase subunit 1 [Dokdonia sp. Hel_I_63]|uniref:sulfate adenylyltransferase subunit 1 n=1 Tax=Dokdonia sp. Hel_I_63 TaxID=1249996 RepID=UPI00119C4354|nr:GTP-binding protein [Dokdonia sp. Hel_I_63]TVZ22045.1 sulfate adenylyltransferase subunit 1 [Dokdonia sp. Hel_I_63]
MEVLKLATAGSVDDGKSTLIGRLLYDTQSLTDDKLEAIEKSSKKLGYDYLDFSLATDGLVAEREQGITIDVAHIYFSTPTKSYIIADSPGHVEYTRNMITGASNASVSIILIDARKGVIEQTFRHFFINALLQVKHVVIAVNKMDLVDYDQSVFDSIKNDIDALRAKSGYKDQEITFIPISALTGDNVASASAKMDWYQGPSILEYLENVIPEAASDTPMRFPVQSVIRPKTNAFHDFRGYAGKVYGSSIAVGDEITVLPSLKSSKVQDIFSYKDSFKEAPAGNSITLTLEDDINVTRGDVIVKSTEVPQQTKELTATVCWMDDMVLTAGKKYELQHTTQRILAKVSQIQEIIPTDFSIPEAGASEVTINEIATVHFKLAKSLFYDRYTDHKQGGSFIIIDPITNTTAGVGFIQ